MLLFSCINLGLIAQNYSLQKCIEIALVNSTSTKQLSIIQEELKLKNEVSNINNLPKLTLNGGATYQSDVTSLQVSFPGISIPLPQKDQYKLTLDLQQNIWDGGLNNITKKVNNLISKTDEYQIKVDNHMIAEQITQLYYSLALIEKQLNNIDFVEKQLNAKQSKIENNYKNGTVSKADILQIKSSLIELGQQRNELNANKTGIIKSLSIWMKEDLSLTFLTTEVISTITAYDENIDRPEMQLLKSKQSLIAANQQLIQSKYNPKVSLFATGGYGRPGLNFLARDFAFYGIGGVNVRVPLDQFLFGINKKEKNILIQQSDKITQQIAQFDQKQKAQLAIKKAEIDRLESNIKTDKDLISIKNSLKEIADVRFNEGVTTSADYIDAVQAALIAANNLDLHSTQLALAKAQYNLIKGGTY